MLDTIVLGRYEIKKQVRKNDLFVEYWGKDLQTGSDISAIAIHAQLVPAMDFFPRFESIKNKLANLNSKHAAAWIESGEVDGGAVLIRAHIDGVSLLDMLNASENGLPMDAALDIAQQLGEYLDLLHRLGLTQISFDLEDILLSAEDALKVTNLGLAQGLNMGELLSTNKIEVRSSYAPELLKNNRVDARTDFYSLGAVLFRILTGREWDTSYISTDKTLSEESLPSQIRSGASNEWDVLISKCLHPNSARRMQSAAEFLNQVDEIRQSMMPTSSTSPMGMEEALVGQTLGGYRLVSRLGQGGMATVYKAYEPALDRYVAIKVLPQFFANDPVFVQRFRREAKAVAQLNHPNIVPIYSYGESAGITYIAMQFVMGDTLKHDGQKFSFDESLRLLAPVARALGYAHQRGIVHRDVKPSNILLTEGNWPVLADFGLALMAQVSGKLTASGVGMGTPMYMSPEQGQGGKVDHRTDIYSLGIVLYEMITGDVPFRADTPMAIVIKHISSPMPVPRQVNPDIPDYLEAIILKATAKNPEDRYQTADEMAVAMENALRRLSAEAPAQRRPVKELPKTEIQQAVKRPVMSESKAVDGGKAQKSTSRIFLQIGLVALAGIFALICLGVALMGVLKICPSSSSTLPWCAAASPTSQPVTSATSSNASTPSSPDVSSLPSGPVIDDFDNGTPKGRTGWESYFEDNRDTKLDCYVEDSHELSDSNYLNFQFDVAENSWATCGFYFDAAQNWSSGQGISFDLRSTEPNAEYQIELFGGTPDALTTYVYWTSTPPDSVNDWVHVEIPWSEILRADWEENPGTVFDPSNVTAFVIGLSTPETSRQSGTMWIDNLSLWGVQADSSDQVYLEDFEKSGTVEIESYLAEGTGTTTACSLDTTLAYEGSGSLKFNFDAAPDAWASCNPSFLNEENWSGGQKVVFYVHTDQANLPLEVYLLGGPFGVHETYTYELTTTSASVDGWERVEINLKDFLRASWEENPGTPVNPASVIGFAFVVNAPSDARLTGNLWVDNFQVITASQTTTEPFTGTWQGLDPDDGSVITITMSRSGDSLTGTFSDTFSGTNPPPGYEGTGSGTILSPSTAQMLFHVTRHDGNTADFQVNFAFSDQDNTLNVTSDSFSAPWVMKRQ
jgi:serine/threonine protein kinase